MKRERVAFVAGLLLAGIMLALTAGCSIPLTSNAPSQSAALGALSDGASKIADGAQDLLQASDQLNEATARQEGIVKALEGTADVMRAGAQLAPSPGNWLLGGGAVAITALASFLSRRSGYNARESEQSKIDLAWEEAQARAGK